MNNKHYLDDLNRICDQAAMSATTHKESCDELACNLFDDKRKAVAFLDVYDRVFDYMLQEQIFTIEDIKFFLSEDKVSIRTSQYLQAFIEYLQDGMIINYQICFDFMRMINLATVYLVKLRVCRQASKELREKLEKSDFSVQQYKKFLKEFLYTKLDKLQQEERYTS